MPELRWILLVAGIVVIGAVYFLGRRSMSAGAAKSAAERRPPSLGETGDPAAGVNDIQRRDPVLEEDLPDLPDPPPVAATPRRPAIPERPAHEQKIVTLRVAARGAQRIGGDLLVSALRDEGLQHGQFKIFHRHVDDDADNAAVFSVASLVEPGHFDLDRLDEVSTPGVSLFMLLPGPKDGLEAFSDMLATARKLADALEADVLDEVGSTLSRQAESHVREEIVNYQHRLATLRST